MKEKYLVFDTETYSIDPEADSFVNDSSEINIHTSRPFMVSYGVYDETLQVIKKDYFVFYDNLDDKRNFYKPEQQHKEEVFKSYLQVCPTIIGANIKYDIHALLNQGYDFKLFENKNYIDVQVLARLVINTDKQDQPNFRVALKPLATFYLGTDSDLEEKKIRLESQELVKNHKELFAKEFLKRFNIQGRTTDLINDIYFNKTWCLHFDDYPKEYKEFRKEFFKKHRRPNYSDCPSVYTYGANDETLTYGLFKLWYPEAVSLKQSENIKKVSGAVIPLVVMERNGLELDVDRMMKDRTILKNKLSSTKIISPIDGSTVTLNQNAKLKAIYEYESGEVLASSDKHARADILDKSKTARTVEELKTLDKYLTSYVTRLLVKLTLCDDGIYRIFTQYKMSGTITGRLSSDFQQFPKEPLELDDGTIIDIRSWFKVPRGYDYMFYLDYSQLELRLQCEWSALVDGSPDKIMTRAFMPYDCIQRDGKYYLNEDQTVEWKPTDLHAMTAKNAFPGIDETNEHWKHYRKLGKSCNFA